MSEYTIWDKVLWDESTVKILKLLKDGEKRFSDFIKSGIPRTTLDRRLKQLGINGLIEFRKDFVTGRKGYVLTPLGRKILQKLEEIEQIYEEEMMKAPPEGRAFLEEDS